MRSMLLNGSQEEVDEQALSSSFSVWARHAKQLASPRDPQHVPPSGASVPAASGGTVVGGAAAQMCCAKSQAIPGKEAQSRSLWHWSAFFCEAISEHPHQMMLAPMSIVPNCPRRSR
jgi:hypothetical protein